MQVPYKDVMFISTYSICTAKQSTIFPDTMALCGCFVIVTVFGVLCYIYGMVRNAMLTGADNKVYECTQCGKHFDTSKQLTQHINTHSSERPFRCLQVFYCVVLLCFIETGGHMVFEIYPLSLTGFLEMLWMDF